MNKLKSGLYQTEEKLVRTKWISKVCRKELFDVQEETEGGKELKKATEGRKERLQTARRAADRKSNILTESYEMNRKRHFS